MMSSHMFDRWRIIAAQLLLVAGLFLPSTAQALSLKEFPLGENNGAVCSAVPDLDDPAAQSRGAKAWQIRCLGFDIAFGHIYYYDRDGADALGADGAFQTALKDR